MAAQLFPQFLLPVGPASTPAIGPPLLPLGISRMELHITALDPATLLDLTLEASLDDGVTWQGASGVGGATPRGKTGAFIGEIAWRADGIFGTAHVSDAHSRLRLSGNNRSGQAVLLGPGTVTLS